MAETTERFVWKVEYELQINNDEGDREHFGGYDATMVCSDNVIDVVRELKSKWAGKTMRCELDGEVFVSHIVGVKVVGAEIVATLTDFIEQISEAEGEKE